MNIIHDKIKVHSLTGRITEDLMLKAFKAVKKNKGAAGIDKITISLYEKNLADNLLSLMRELKKGTFQPAPLRRCTFQKVMVKHAHWEYPLSNGFDMWKSELLTSKNNHPQR